MHILHTTLLLAITAAPLAVASIKAAINPHKADTGILASLPFVSKAAPHTGPHTAVDSQFATDLGNILTFVKTAETAGTPAELHKFKCTHGSSPYSHRPDIQWLACVFSNPPTVAEVTAVVDGFLKTDILVSQGQLVKRGKLYLYDMKSDKFGRNQQVEQSWGMKPGLTKEYTAEVTGHISHGKKFFDTIRFVYGKEY